MGQGFWVLVWDDFGLGLNMINPRLHIDQEGHNWFTYNDNNKQEVIDSMELDDKYGSYWKIVD